MHSSFTDLIKTAWKRITPLCRVLLSFEPAFAGWVPPRVLRLGSGLSRHAHEIGTPFVGVGSKPGCGNTRTAGSLFFIPRIKIAEQVILIRISNLTILLVVSAMDTPV